MLKIGWPAPDFTALTDEERPFRLSDWRGKKHVVLYFYPKDFTAGCTREACEFRDNFQALMGEGAALVGISADGVESHRRFREKYALPFPLVSDAEQAVAALYEAQRRFPFPVIQRITYVIDRDGIVRGAFRHELAISRHREDVLETLRRLNSPP